MAGFIRARSGKTLTMPVTTDGDPSSVVPQKMIANFLNHVGWGRRISSRIFLACICTIRLQQSALEV